MIYLRDMNDDQKQTWINEIQQAHRDDLIKAYKNGEDIQIGEAFAPKDCKVV